MHLRIPNVGGESDLRCELFARTKETERPPILDADPEQKWRLTSALQKSIRRGYTDDAVKFATMLHSVDPQYAWRRLAVIALEDVGFGDPLSAALALEANRSFRFRQQLGERLVLAAVVTGLAEGTKSRSICDLCTAAASPTQLITSSEFRAYTSSSEAPWLIRYLATRGFSHADLGKFVLPVWERLGDIDCIEHAPDPYGDEVIEGLPAASYDMYTAEGKRAMAYLSKCPPFRSFSPAQIGMTVFLVEGSYLDRSLVSLEIGAREIEAKLADYRSVGIEDTMIAAELTTHVREHRELLNKARRRILG